MLGQGERKRSRLPYYLAAGILFIFIVGSLYRQPASPAAESSPDAVDDNAWEQETPAPATDESGFQDYDEPVIEESPPATIDDIAFEDFKQPPALENLPTTIDDIGFKDFASPATQERPPPVPQDSHAETNNTGSHSSYIPSTSAGGNSSDPVLVLDYAHETKQHTVISSQSTADGHWFELHWGDYTAYNLNMLPHPWKNSTYIMVAQAGQGSISEPGDPAGPVYSMEMTCEAQYNSTSKNMECLKSPLNLPIASTASPNCVGDGFEWFNWLIGPSDARVFKGPDGKPYIIYVSMSQYGCLGPHMHDLRRLVRWDDFTATDSSQQFFHATELPRPPPRSPVEKNWFAFWDTHDQLYIHYNIHPTRSFARIEANGSASEDLAPLAADTDAACLAKYLPPILATEKVHQATNSLSLTFCNRTDPSCSSSNATYIATIFHHKLYYGHNLYEPYLMLYHPTPPFQLYAISKHPFWVSGRGKPGAEEHVKWTNDTSMPVEQSQMMFMVSMNWKGKDVHYRGFLDDQVLLSFGVEDRRSGAIDVLAGDLVQHLNLCEG